MDKDWLFKSGNSICSFRSAGVLVRNNKLLVQRDINSSDYALPGGHVKIGELAEESLIREFKEETGADISCDRLIWVEECFWEWNKTKMSTIAFYYLVELSNIGDLPDNDSFVAQKDNDNVELGWVSLRELKNLNIYPLFLKEKISNIAEGVEHFVTKD